MGAGWRGVALKLIVVYLFYSPLKNMIGQKFSLSGPPRWYHKKRAHPTLELLWGRGLSCRNGQRRTMGGGRGCGGRRPWFPCCENIEWFQMCTFLVNRRCCCFRSENSDALLYLKLWYSFYIRVEYQRLHENNLMRRRQHMWGTTSRQASTAFLAGKKHQVLFSEETSHA
jgi:hypothetical protein